MYTIFWNNFSDDIFGLNFKMVLFWVIFKHCLFFLCGHISKLILLKNVEGQKKCEVENKAVEKWTEVLGCLEFLAWWSHLFNCIWFPTRSFSSASKTPGGYRKLSGYCYHRPLVMLHHRSIFPTNWNTSSILEKCPCLPDKNWLYRLDTSDTEWYWLGPRQKLFA